MNEPMQRRVLLVDDDPAFCRIVQRRLEQVGYLVDLAVNGDAGLAAAQSGKYDAILVDQDLPDRSGMDVVRGLQRLRSVPTIMVTATGNE
jgi:DNA-binding response OmpR family regulator